MIPPQAQASGINGSDGMGPLYVVDSLFECVFDIQQITIQERDLWMKVGQMFRLELVGVL